MANEIDAALVIQFSDQVHVAAQQMKARLRPYTKIKAMKGETFAYDGLDSVEAQELVGRLQPVVFSDINHNRRKIGRRRFVLTLPVDAADVRGVLISPESEYAGACARAMERIYDRVVVESLFAAVLTGRDMGTSVAFSSDGGATVTATAGLTYARLVEIAKGFMDDDVGNDSPEDFVLGISGDEHSALMQEIELVSGDFTRQYAIEKGRMIEAAGFKLIPFAGAAVHPILDVTAGVRSCFAMSTRGVCVGLSKEVSLKIEPRPDLVETTQVQAVFDLGSVRTEGKLVKKVTTTDA